uniref:Uncharacterized protein n=2 Tax=Araneus ventricosus TaxID=182803 RepID=A0A4Y2DBM9_ARAVE|nr:hypothetical protein AVEN_3405-1 [Araneus ventricosus]
MFTRCEKNEASSSCPVAVTWWAKESHEEDRLLQSADHLRDSGRQERRRERATQEGRSLQEEQEEAHQEEGAPPQRHPGRGQRRIAHLPHIMPATHIETSRFQTEDTTQLSRNSISNKRTFINQQEK